MDLTDTGALARVTAKLADLQMKLDREGILRAERAEAELADARAKLDRAWALAVEWQAGPHPDSDCCLHCNSYKLLIALGGGPGQVEEGD